MRIVIGIAIVAMGMGVSSPAQSLGSDGVTTEEGFSVSMEARQKIEPIVRAGGASVHYFEGPGGLIGIGLTQWNGQQSIAWATADGAALIGGVMIDTARQSNLTARYIDQELPKPDLSPIMRDVEQTTIGFEQGDKGSENEFYVFVDPTCRYCQQAYAAFQTLLTQENDIRIRWIPVGILGAAGENRAAAALGTGGDGFQMLQAFLAKQAAAVNPEDVANGQTAHQNNLAMFRKLRFDGVPAIVSRVNGEFQVKTGVADMTKLRAQLRGASAGVAAAGTGGQ